MSADPAPYPTEARRQVRWVAPLAWASVALEGFDLVVLGVVLSPMLRDGVWGLTPNAGALISSAGLVGVMVGAIASAPPPTSSAVAAPCCSPSSVRGATTKAIA